MNDKPEDQRRRKPVAYVPPSLTSAVLVAAWNDGYQAALARCETAVYEGMDSLHQLLQEGRKE